MRKANVEAPKTEEKEQIKIQVIKKIQEEKPNLMDAPDEEKVPTKSRTISFRAFEHDADLLDEYAMLVNGTKAGALCKKLIYDSYNSKGSTAIKILEQLEDFDGKNKAEIIEMIKVKEAEIIEKEKTKRDKDVQRVARKLRS